MEYSSWIPVADERNAYGTFFADWRDHPEMEQNCNWLKEKM